MSNRELAPILFRLKRLEKKKIRAPSKEPPVGFFKDPSKVISVAAFIISLATTFFSWRRENIESQIAQRRQLDAALQQLIDVGIKKYEFAIKNQNNPNVGEMNNWFSAQTGLSAQKSAQELTLSKSGTMLDYIVVGDALLSTDQYGAAINVFARAIEIGESKQTKRQTIIDRSAKFIRQALYGENIEDTLTEEQRSHDLISAYAARAKGLIAQDRLEEAAVQFENSKRVIEETSYDKDFKAFSKAWVHRVWGDTLIQYRRKCADAKHHFETAVQLFPETYKSGNSEWSWIQYRLSMIDCPASKANAWRASDPEVTIELLMRMKERNWFGNGP